MAIDTLADMEAAFAGIPLDRVSVSLTINGMAAPITAMYYAVAEQQGAAADRVVTTPQNDILKEFVARGTWIYPVEPVAAAGRRSHRVLGPPLPALQPGVGVRLSHPRGRVHDRPGDGLRPGHRRPPTWR